MKTIIPGVLALSALLMASSVSAQTQAAPVAASAQTPAPSVPASAPTPAAAVAASAQKGAINLNTATLDQLDRLPGIGRKTAERILEQRQKSGGFKKIEELMNVKGVGEKSFLKIKPMVFVAPKSDKAGGGGF